MLTADSPFHDGEIEAQSRAGTTARANEGAGFIRQHMPRQHRDFFADLPFLVAAGADEAGRTWITILEAKDRVVAAHSENSLVLASGLPPDDPLAAGFVPGAAIGLLGIELSTRRRNRVNGRLRATGVDGQLVLDVDQSFGNCAQYIHERSWSRVDAPRPGPGRRSARPDAAQRRRIEAADTVFIGSGYRRGQERAESGFDASHRGGTPGFLRFDAKGRLRIPDYAGNDFFNTIGNLLRDPRVGLVFVDFETGGLLQLSGRAEICWDGSQSHDPQARREIIVTPDLVVDRPAALSLRWQRPEQDKLRLRIVDKVIESDAVTSFHLAAADGGPLPGFTAGQHLPVVLNLPGQAGEIVRTYSLSGPPNAAFWRISVKREAGGLASCHLHDRTGIGDVITARRPSGDFVLPEGDAPLILVSAGVGATPMLSMLHAIAADGDARPVWYIHATRNGRTHVFDRETAALAALADTIHRQIYFSAPDGGDVQKGDRHGRITARDLLDLGASAGAQYLFCGPPGFVADLATGLERLHVDPGHIHHESFGTTASQA